MRSGTVLVPGSTFRSLTERTMYAAARAVRPRDAFRDQRFLALDLCEAVYDFSARTRFGVQFELRLWTVELAVPATVVVATCHGSRGRACGRLPPRRPARV